MIIIGVICLICGIVLAVIGISGIRYEAPKKPDEMCLNCEFLYDSVNGVGQCSKSNPKLGGYRWIYNHCDMWELRK